MHTGRAVRHLAGAAAIVGALAAGPVAAASGAQDNAYVTHNLVSDVPGAADTLDPNLVNGWGLVSGPTTPWWVADNGTDLSTLYTATGAIVPLVVGVEGAPTGLVFNGDPSAFKVGATGARFIFATESGTILGWNGGAAAQKEVDESAAGDVYKGLAIAQAATGPRLYATDFHNGAVDVFDASWQPVAMPGAFMDPRLPEHYAPFGIQAIGDRIFVTYARQQAGSDDELAGQGLGVVDAYDTSGRLLARVAQHGQLNAPWGLAQAPASFGRFGGDLLVGNFGDGMINAYEERGDGAFEHRGTLRTPEHGKLAIDGLWALEFGHGAPNNGPTDTLFFTAGPDDESHGLFGTITPAAP